MTTRRRDGDSSRVQAGTDRQATTTDGTRSRHAFLRASRSTIALALALACSGCGGSMPKVTVLGMGGGGPKLGQPGYVKGFLGGVVTDEPAAAQVGRNVLARGGDAADAAVAVAFTLAVTLPSRAGLGGGGACLAYDPARKSTNGGVPQAILFVPGAPAQAPGANADRPAALPMLARGLYLLHARYGRLPFKDLILPAEREARLGVPVSRTLARDLAPVAGPLFGDPQARAVFSRDGVPLKAGQRLVQPELASTLATLRTAGVGDFYQGVLAQRIAKNSPLIGGPLTSTELRHALAKVAVPLEITAGRNEVAFLPPPADGGLAAAAGFESLLHDPSNVSAATERALAVAERWRQGGVSAESLLHATDLPPAGAPTLPASTSFATMDRHGNAVICDLTMNNLFGTGRMVPGMGFLLAASPAAVPPPLLAAALAWNRHIHAFRAEVGGSGEAGAPMAVAVGMLNTLRTGKAMPAPVPAPGRANVIACSRYLPGEHKSCAWASDPRGTGLALGGG